VRRHSRSASVLAVLLLTVLAGLAACGGGDDDDAMTPSNGGLAVRIGDSVPLSGDLEAYGEPAKKAADLAVEQIRRAVIEAGRGDAIEVVHVDNKTDTEEAVKAARKLADDNSSCIVGAWAPRDTVRTAEEVSIPRGILQISPASTSDEIARIKDKGLLNRTVTPDSLQGPALADAIEQALGGTRGRVINIGARDDSYGRALVDSFSGAWQRVGGRVGQRVVYAAQQGSFESEAERLSQGDPDGWVIFDFPDTYAKLGRALSATGRWAARDTWVTDSLAAADLPKRAGFDATEGLRGTAPGTPSRGPAADAFSRLYAGKKGDPAQRFGAQTFDATVLCYLAAVAAGSTDGQKMAAEVRQISAPPGTMYTWEQLPAAIRALASGDDIDYEGASGPIDMDRAGAPTAGYFDLFRFADGKIKLFGETQVPTPPEPGE
jgi:branched-chain amino acid transport system substrate-binding protein